MASCYQEGISGCNSIRDDSFGRSPPSGLESQSGWLSSVCIVQLSEGWLRCVGSHRRSGAEGDRILYSCLTGGSGVSAATTGLELKVIRFGRMTLISKDVQPYSLERLLEKHVEYRLQRTHPADPHLAREVCTSCLLTFSRCVTVAGGSVVRTSPLSGDGGDGGRGLCVGWWRVGRLRWKVGAAADLCR